MSNTRFYRAKRSDNKEWVKWTIYSGIYGVDLDEDTVSPDTGLKDDDGNLIFENDILLLKDEVNGYEWKAYVKFGNPNGRYTYGFQLVPLNECLVNTDILLWVETEMSYIKCRIIGNIFDGEKKNEEKCIHCLRE